MSETIILDIITKKDKKLVKCKIELPILVARKEMSFASLITEISFNPERYKIATGYAKKILLEIYDDDLSDIECEKILNSYRGMGIMSGEVCEKFDEIAAIFVRHCISMCKLKNDGTLLENTYTPKTNQAIYKMIETKSLLNEVYQYEYKNNEMIKIGKINLTNLKPELI